jgi:hypothetical protein
MDIDDENDNNDDDDKNEPKTKRGKHVNICDQVLVNIQKRLQKCLLKLRQNT